MWECLALQDIGEEFVEFLEKELNINDSGEAEGDNDWSFEGKSNTKSSEEKKKDNNESSIEDSIDDIEAALAQLKKELGL